MIVRLADIKKPQDNLSITWRPATITTLLPLDLFTYFFISFIHSPAFSVRSIPLHIDFDWWSFMFLKLLT